MNAPAAFQGSYSDLKVVERLNSTALEIGRQMGREEAATICEEYVAALQRDAAAIKGEAYPEITPENLGAIIKDMHSRASAVRIAVHHIRSTPSTLDIGATVEGCAEAVHVEYLATYRRLGRLINPHYDRPYAELPENAKELDRATARAVLTHLGLMP